MVARSNWPVAMSNCITQLTQLIREWVVAFQHLMFVAVASARKEWTLSQDDPEHAVLEDHVPPQSTTNPIVFGDPSSEG